MVAGRYVRIELSNGQNGDYGIMEIGSSGAPYINDNNLIFAQHRGGAILTCTNTGNMWAGRISQSWEGNGTNDSRLRNWLGASTNPNTMDCMEGSYITGPDILCSPDVKHFTLVENMPCDKKITWSIDPSGLVSIQSVSGGNTFAIKPIADVSGNVTLTAKLSAIACNDIVINHDIWIGKPEKPQYFLQAWYDPMIERIVLSIPPVPGATSYNWTVENLTFNNRSNYEKFYFQACPSELFDIRFSVSAVNECGESPKLYGRIDRNCGFHHPTLSSPVTVYPKPSNASYVIVARQSDDIKKKNIEEVTLNGELLSIDGRIIRKFELPVNGQYRFDDLTAGVYLLKMYDGKDILSIEKIVVF